MLPLLEKTRKGAKMRTLKDLFIESGAISNWKGTFGEWVTATVGSHNDGDDRWTRHKLELEKEKLIEELKSFVLKEEMQSSSRQLAIYLLGFLGFPPDKDMVKAFMGEADENSPGKES
jgi:hypothetical protein